MPNRLTVVHLERYWPTTDDWYPCFPRNTVLVRVTSLRDGMVRCSVWGADDFGLERDLPEQDLAKQVNFALNLPNPVTIEWLRGQGFWSA